MSQEVSTTPKPSVSSPTLTTVSPDFKGHQHVQASHRCHGPSEPGTQFKQNRILYISLVNTRGCTKTPHTHRDQMLLLDVLPVLDAEGTSTGCLHVVDTNGLFIILGVRLFHDCQKPMQLVVFRIFLRLFPLRCVVLGKGQMQAYHIRSHVSIDVLLLRAAGWQKKYFSKRSL